MIFADDAKLSNALADNPSEELLKERLVALLSKGSPMTQSDTSEEDKGIFKLK